jgi:ADP-ribose pyrophosphatase YjhB (NUDIX family)/adenosine deaminase
MADLQFNLDSGARHFLRFSADRGRVSLHHSQGSRRSVLHNAFRRNLCLRAAGTQFGFADGDVVELGCVLEALRGPGVAGAAAGAQHVSVHIGDMVLGQIALAEEPSIIGERYLLSPFESRFLAENGQPHPTTGLHRTTDHSLVTDLHVHFAGCVSARDLIRIGIESGAMYPVANLEEVGIRPHASGRVALADLPAEFLAQLEAALAIPLDRRIPFVEMSRIYKLRSPLTKNRDAFLPLIRQLAQDYAAMGVRYAELSLADIVEAERLRIVHHEAPAIEAQFGVTLRFLAAISRHDDLEWDLDLIERIASLGRSRYLAGVDFMGHETNSTHQFARQIRALAQWADKSRPGFTIRVHAGENPAYPENVRVAVEAAAGFNVQMRIGHGLYGVDEATLALLRTRGTIVEFNLNSNLALNNIQSAHDAPIVRYLRAGVPVVLGTDGYGIYQTTPELETRAALLCGVLPEDLAAIRATERRYLDHRQRCDLTATAEPAAFLVPGDVPHRHYVPEVLAKKAAAIHARDEALKARIAEMAVPLLDPAGVNALLRGKRCISIAGAWNKSWNALPVDQQTKIAQVIAGLIEGLPASQTVLITGGTRLGVEGQVQALAIARGFAVLATLVNETRPDWLDDGAFTHAHIVGENLYDKAAGLYALVKEHNGMCLFIGGSSIVNDEIQTAINLRLRYLLMDGVTGASAQRAHQQPQYAFTTADEALAMLDQPHAWGGMHEPYWHLGANPIVDMIVTRRCPQRGIPQVLLIRRDLDAPTEGGKWALPGGFQSTRAPRGTAWRADVETARQACIRELREETGLDVAALMEQLVHVGDYEGSGRDPRDTDEAWSKAQVFALQLPDVLATAPLRGGDDACDARWFDLDEVPEDLAFDHDKILAHGLAALP